ncbi:hypothetical protein LSTR_LSTR002828 [Laodelphax striatellus]|uniref:PiggyBac transposable element-derived protein domain-containing protein n=1 Tax=Laodelphax striatellus TaxID=195883 RepID=A0A482XH77_LAOST|nr:hypothetical protein LSTR_LSTR002828 [Laodelphax striatellus]
MDSLAGPSSRISFLDSDFEETLEQWHEDSVGSEVDSDDNISVHSDHNTVSEQGESEDNVEQSVDEPPLETRANIGDSQNTSDSEEVIGEIDNDEDEEPDTSNRRRKKNYFGRNRYRWSADPVLRRSRVRQHNIIRIPTVRPPAQIGDNPTPTSIWNLLFTENMLNTVLKWTNEKINKERPNYDEHAWHETDVCELRAFLGLLFYSAIFKSNRADYKSLYATDGSGRDIFRCVISKSRFGVLLNCLRFDDPTTRGERRKTDALAPISEIFSEFINNCQVLYKIGESACVDEMLVAFRGRCKFKMYIPNKPCKYGLKIMCLTDARTGYLFNAYVYAGKDSDGLTLDAQEKKLMKPTQSVIRLAKPLEQSNRNITADNWFSSIELANVLRTKGLTYVGTIKKNKKEIPTEFLPNRKKELGSSMFGFTNDTTLVSYSPKKAKAVLLISTMHHEKSIDKDTGKPEIIMYYNQTKGGVDALDEKCAKYSSARRTQRWPMAIFFRMLDVSGVNSFILHNLYKERAPITRFKFLKTLAEELVKPQLERRLQNVRLTYELRACIRRVLGVEESKPDTAEEKLTVRKTCYTCNPKKKRKTAYLCHCCKKPVCLECTTKICNACKSVL